MAPQHRAFLVHVRDEYGDVITFRADSIDFEPTSDPWAPFVIEIEGARDFG